MITCGLKALWKYEWRRFLLLILNIFWFSPKPQGCTLESRPLDIWVVDKLMCYHSLYWVWPVAFSRIWNTSCLEAFVWIESRSSAMDPQIFSISSTRTLTFSDRNVIIALYDQKMLWIQTPAAPPNHIHVVHPLDCPRLLMGLSTYRVFSIHVWVRHCEYGVTGNSSH